MAVRQVSIFKEAYRGVKDTDSCMKIDGFLDAVSSGKITKIPQYEKTIYDLTNESVDKIKEQGHSDGVHKRVGSLRDYQTLGVRFMLLSGNCLLTDSVGLGKTAQVSAVINLVSTAKRKAQGSPFAFIYLTELSLVEQTRNELIRFTGSYVHSSNGEAANVEKLFEDISEKGFGGLVASYSIVSSHLFMSHLNAWVSENGLVDYLFIDEGSVLRSKRTSTYKNFSTLRDNFCKTRVLMNATPFESTIDTMYSQLDFVDPQAFPTKTQFEKMYVKLSYPSRVIIGYKNAEQFKRAVRYFIWGHTREELGSTFDSCMATVSLYRLTPVQKALLKKVSRPDYVFDDISWFNPKEYVYDIHTVPKVSLTLDILTKRVSGEHAIVYCMKKETQHNLVELLERNGYDAILLNGDDNTAKKKAEKVDLFRSKKGSVLVTNVTKGLNLDFVNHLIFYSFSGNSGLMNQVEGRIIRSQSVANKHIYLMFAHTNEIQVFEKARQNLSNVSDFTKSEFSLLNYTLSNMGAVVKVMQNAMNGVGVEFPAPYQDAKKVSSLHAEIGIHLEDNVVTNEIVHLRTIDYKL